MADFAKIFKGLRLERGLTQDELAKRLGISKSTVSMYENGRRLPAFDAVESITDFFGVDLKYLLGQSDTVEKLSGDETDIESGISVELTAGELNLIKQYRHADEQTKRVVEYALRLSGGKL